MISSVNILLLVMWVLSFVMIVYGLIGLKRGKVVAVASLPLLYFIRRYRKYAVLNRLMGKWAYVYSGILVVLGGGLLMGLIYNAINCGVLSLCD